MPPALRPRRPAPAPAPPPSAWWQVLLAARRLEARNAADGKGQGFISGELARECGFDRRFGQRRGTRVASAWCSKFERWGYLKSDVAEGGRGGSKLYLLTSWGRRRSPPRRSR